MPELRTVRCGAELSFGGEAMASVDGRTIFVRGGIPGELVRVRPAGRRRGHEVVDVVEVLEASAARREPACAHFGACGGCQLQHIDYAAQLEAKRSVLAHALRVPPSSIVVRESVEYGYRARVRLVADQRRFGFRRPRSHDVLEFDSCPVLTPSLEVALLAYRERLRSTPMAAPPKEFEVLEGEDAIAAWPPVPGFSLEALRVHCGDEELVAGADAFFQANRPMLASFVEQVVELAGTGASAVDLYSGVGLFSFALSRRFAQVRAIEGSPVASAHARAGLAAKPREGLGMHAYDAAEWLEAFAGRVSRGAEARPDVIVLDPPRSGAKDALAALLAVGAPRVVYVSCDPQTLGRDLETLRGPAPDGSCYDIETVVLFDLFPQTYHMESVVALRKRREA